MKEINKLYIIPAIFIEYREDGNVLLKCLQGEEIVNRAFEPILVRGIKDPKYLLIGIKTGANMMQIDMCDGSDYENLFREKWNVLLK